MRLGSEISARVAVWRLACSHRCFSVLLLRDPLLPDELLPADWEGRAARQLARNLYRLTGQGAETWVSQHAETAQGPLPEAGDGFYQRFGGLD